MNLTPIQAPAHDATYAKNTVPAAILSTQLEIHAELWVFGDNAPLVAASYVPDFSGKVHVDFSDIYRDVLETELPSGGENAVAQSNYRVKFRLLLSDSEDNSTAVEYWVCNALLKSSTPFETWAQANFLTNQPIEKHTNYEAPEWLTYLALSKGGTNLKVRFYKKTGGSVDTLILSNNTDGCFTVNVNYKRIVRLANVLPGTLLGYYDVILFDGSGNEMCRQRYVFEERTGLEKYFLFVNALGGIDTLVCKGENVLKPETTHNIGRFGDKHKAIDDTVDRRVWEQNTGMFPNRYRNWLHELMTAKQAAALHDAKGDTCAEIVVTASDISVSDFGQLASASFSYILEEAVNVISDTEQASDRSLHQSVADQAETLEDLTTEVILQTKPVQGGGFETDEETLPATKLYVTWDENLKDGIEVFVEVDGNSAGSFVTGTDTQPYIVTKTAGQTVQFLTEDDTIESVTVTYYPVTVQAL